MARDIGNSSVLRPFAGREVAPGFLRAPERERFFRNGVEVWHQSGTARWAAIRCRWSTEVEVYGVERLRIVDSSVMPQVTTGDTAPCVVIGERAAEIPATQKRTTAPPAAAIEREPGSRRRLRRFPEMSLH